jgi:F-type H+-transporting ATPase subunit b
MILLAEDAPHVPNPIIPIWQEIVVGSIAFAVLCFVLMKFVFPRMEATFKARVEAIEGGIKRAEERQAEANALFEQYQQQLAEARGEAAQILEEARTRAEGLRNDLRTEVGTLAVDLASRIVGESLADEARQRGTVERFLNDLDAAPAAGGRS